MAILRVLGDCLPDIYLYANISQSINIPIHESPWQGHTLVEAKQTPATRHHSTASAALPPRRAVMQSRTVLIRTHASPLAHAIDRRCGTARTCHGSFTAVVAPDLLHMPAMGHLSRCVSAYGQ